MHPATKGALRGGRAKRGRNVTDLLVAVYGREDTAAHVLGVLRAQGEVPAASLESAAVIQRWRNGEITVIRTEDPRTPGSFWGVFWEALFGLIFHTPTPAPAHSSNLGRFFGTLERAGLDERFRASVRQTLGCSTSALALLVLNWNTESLLSQLYLRPDAFVRARLASQQDVVLLRELGGLPPDGSFDDVRQSERC